MVLNQGLLEGCGGGRVTTLTAEATMAFSRWEPGTLNNLRCAGQTHRIIQPKMLSIIGDAD